MSSTTPLWERLVALAYLPAVLVVFAVWAARRMLPLGTSWRERVGSLLAEREPSVVFDSARVIVLLAWMGNTPDLDLVVGYLRRGIPWCQGYGIFQWVDVNAVPPMTVVVLTWIYRAALVLVIGGVRARAAAAVAAICHAAMWSIAFSTAHGSVHNHVVFMILVSIALLPEPLVPLRRYVAAVRAKQPLAEVGSYPAYVRFTAIFAVCAVYMQTGIEKIQTGGPRWLNGITLQGHMMRKGQFSTAITTLPLGFFVGLAAFVVLWETWFGVVVFWPRSRPFAVVSAWVFHEWIRWGMGVWPFFFLEAACLFVFTPYEAVRWLRDRRAPRMAASAEAAPTKAASTPPQRLEPRVALLIALMAVQWIPTFVRRGVYPLTGNAMFSGALKPGQFIVGGARIEVLGERGAHEVTPEDAVSIRGLRWNEVVFEHFISPYREHEKFAAARPQFCETLLGEVTKYADPSARHLTLWMDHFNAGTPGMRAQEMIECDAPKEGAR